MANARLILDRRRAKANGLYPVKIRIGEARKEKLFTTIYSLSDADFQKLLEGKYLNADQKKISAKLEAQINKAQEILDEINNID